MVQRATVEDAKLITKLYREELGYGELTEDLVLDNLKRILDDPQQAVFVLSPDKGFVHVQAIIAINMVPSARIVGFAVDSNQQGQGFGKKLLQAVQTWSIENSLEAIILSSSTFRSQAHGFYESQGFIRTREQYLFEKKLSSK